MRILYSHRVQSRDGQGVHIEELITAFRNEGHQILVTGPGLYNRATFGGESGVVPLLRRSLPNWCTELAEIFYNFISYRRLRRAYEQFSPDFIYERYNLYHLAGALVRRRYRTPLFLEVNSPLADERSRFGRLSFPCLARKLEQQVWRSADGIFVVSAVLKQYVAAAGVPEGKIAVVPNGINLNMFVSNSSIQQPTTSLTIGFIGFIRDWHGLDNVITGLSKNSPKNSIRLMIAGDGPARPALEKLAKKLEITTQVIFLGLQQRQIIPQLIRSFDIAIQPQSVDYASPLKIFEYMACARAIVAPDQPNIREILEHGETALLFNPQDPSALSLAIKQLASDPELRKRLGDAARRTLQERNYTWSGNVSKITAVAAISMARDEAVANRGLDDAPATQRSHNNDK